MQAEIDRLNTTYVQLVDEHNAKQKHIDVSIEVELIGVIERSKAKLRSTDSI